MLSLKKKHPVMIDSHAHCQFEAYDADRELVIRRALEDGIHVINVGVDQQSSEQAVALAERFDTGVWAAVGLHPTNVDAERFDEKIYRRLAEHPKVVALGETGLDFYRLPPAEDAEHRAQTLMRQREAVEGFMRLSEELKLPLICHVRDDGNSMSAHDELIRRIREYDQQSSGFDLRGVIHSFSGNETQARQYIELGFKLGVNGMVTFAHQIGPVIRAVPLEHLLIETDCPYLTPDPHRGKRNEPAYVRYVAKEIARLKHLSFPEVARATLANSGLLFTKIKIDS